MARIPINVLGSSISSAEIDDDSIVNADIKTDAGIVLTKLETISTARVLGRNTASTGAIEVLSTLPNTVQDNITRLGTVTTGSFPAANISGTTLAASVVTSSITTVGTLVAGNVDAAVSSASTIAAGKAEASIASEVNTGTDTARYVSPDSLAGSNFGARILIIPVFDEATAAATGDGKKFFRLPSELNGMNLVRVAADVTTAGTTGTLDIQIRNVTQTADMLSTKITIDTGEESSATAATAAVIDTNNDDVATDDKIAIDIDAVHTTPSQGLRVCLVFQLP